MRKKKMSWPEALVTVVGYIVLGWAIFSIASCTASGIKSRMEMQAKILSTAGVAVY